MKVGQKQEEQKVLDFEGSIGEEDKEFSVDAERFDSLNKALDAVVKRFSGSDITCDFDIRGAEYASWSFMIDGDDIDEVVEKMDKLEGDFSNDG
jgi:hypothetical protein